MLRSLALAAVLCALAIAPARAAVTAKAAQEAAEYVAAKFGKEAAGESVETLTRKIETLAVKHGDEAVTAARKVGPRTFQLVEEAGEQGPAALKLMARRGDDAVWVVAQPNRLALFAKYGDDAAEAMIKHGEVAEPLLSSLGKPAAEALEAVSTQNGRRLAMMADDGALAAIGQTDELLGVVAKHGDRAMDFVWRNKGSLAVAAALGAFLANPQPFLDGTVDLSQAIAEHVAQPLAEVPGQIATEAAKRVEWTWLLTFVAALAALLVAFRMWLRRRRTEPAK